MPVWGLEFAAALDGNSPSEAEAGTLVSRLLDYLRSIQRN
jgi:hypothetical protein